MSDQVPQDLRGNLAGPMTPADPDYYRHGAGDNLPLSYWSTAGAVAQESLNAAPAFGVIPRAIGQSLASAGDQVHPDELNKLYPEMDKPFTKAMSLTEASYLDQLQKERKKNQYLIDHGPQGGLYSAANFLVGLGPQMIDPINILGGRLIGGAMRLGGVGAATSIAGKVAQNYGENLAFNLAASVPNYLQSEREQQNVSIDSEVKGAAFNALGGTAFHFLAPLAFRGVRRAYGGAAEFFGRNEGAQAVVEQSAAAQFASDHPVEVKPHVVDQVREASGTLAKGMPGALYQYRPLMDATDRPFYAAATDNSKAFKDAPKAVVDENLGHGVYLSDNPNVANGLAARKTSQVDGLVHETRVKATNLVNLDEPFQGEARRIVSDFLKEAGVESDLIATKGKDLLTQVKAEIDAGHLPETFLDEMNQSLSDAGYEGYRHEGGKLLGQEGDPHNVVMLFDHQNTGDANGLVEPTRAIPPARQNVGRLTPEEATAFAQQETAPTNVPFADEKSLEDLHKAIEEHLPEQDLNGMKEAIQGAMEQLGALKEQGFNSEEFAKVLEQVNEAEKASQLEEQIIKAATFCLGKDL